MKTTFFNNRLEFLAAISICLLGNMTVSGAELTAQDKIEANIKMAQALEKRGNFEYAETSWRKIQKELETKFDVSIVLDQSARNDSLTEDETLTISLHGIRLKNALSLLLWQKNATFLIKNGTITIYSLDDVGRIEPDVFETPDSKKKRLIQEALDNERVAAKLKLMGTLKYNRKRWGEVEEELEKNLGINIYLAQSAIDDSLTENEPISFEFSGTANNAMQAMLSTKHATFVIEKEVVVIKSLDDRSLRKKE